MLNTHKLLYILPDLSYVAELLPAKKEYTFSIQAFKQINGDFISKQELIPASIEKLFSKLEKEEYHLILPDFLFTNTIVNVDGTSETAVLDHANTVLLPSLNLSKDTHEIQTTVLTSFKGSSKVQISAIEKSVLAPIRVAAQKTETIITAVSPLTWAVKAIISLEPSISILQMGSHLYLSQHYIGVDQASNFPIDEYAAIVETVKILKGAEPSIQSIYLVSSSLVEDDLKEKLSGTLPIQQLASFKEDDSKMPSYIKFIIESTMKTLSISDFPVPQFDLGKASEADLASTQTLNTKTTQEDDELEEEETLPEPTQTEKDEDVKSEESSKTVEPAPDSDLPVPAVIPALSGGVKNTESMSMTIEPLDAADARSEVKAEKKPTDTKKETNTDELPSIPDIDTAKDTLAEETDEKETKIETEAPEAEAPQSTKTETNAEKETVTALKEPETKVAGSDEIDLSQFAGKDTQEDEAPVQESSATNTIATPTLQAPIKSLDKAPKKIIKNSSGVNNMLKMVFITIAVFFITIAIGVGVGLGLLKMSENKSGETTPTVVTETPTPTPTPEPTPEPVVINKAELSILIVNATTKAGYASQIKALLVENEITDVTAANAKGEYETGKNYLLMSAENPDLQKLLEESTQLTFEYSDAVKTEDPTGKYDAVIVLGE